MPGCCPLAARGSANMGAAFDKWSLWVAGIIGAFGAAAFVVLHIIAPTIRAVAVMFAPLVSH